MEAEAVQRETFLVRTDGRSALYAVSVEALALDNSGKPVTDTAASQASDVRSSVFVFQFSKGLSLTILDRGFFGARLLLDIQGGDERHWLTRARSDLNPRVLQRFARGDELIEIPVTRHSLAQDPTLPKTWQMRAIKYRRKGCPEQILLTSLTDAKRFPAAEIIALYHERWELELGYDEIKTELLDREETIRSQKPDGVEQEVWGILLAYNLVRLEMESIAKEADVEPTRISFVEALRLMRDEWEWLSVTSPGAIPKRLQAMRRNVKRYVLPPRRPRRFPRAAQDPHPHHRQAPPRDQ
jgi:hypothetical protein